ncbi:type VII secretion AAA-ATPase EccA [Mycobacterium sp. shizuoka-1]|uniref:AAA ATPase, central domain protein n=1 Tax=Mycolicibacterium gilvum (strain PYR-GCK) TaxID=350054 RepID=A4TG13_MYCGI|nr:type VII secretion AAA-ATPase EccA [Mycobacterium sp. shizuoka-1]GAY16106.1 ESX-1 secretion system protein EccA1 [Mycobacterium sp. shizuoka-1]
MSAAEDRFDAGVAALGIIDGGRADSAQALRYFTAASEEDPQMCDAWLGRMLCGDNETGVIYRAWRSRANMHQQLSRLRVPPAHFVPRFDIGMGIVALDQPIVDRGILTVALARMQAMRTPPDYAEALETLAEAPSTIAGRWLVGAIHYKAQRWPEVISSLGEELGSFEADQLLRVAVDVALGGAHAFLGEFDEAQRYLHSVEAQENLPGAKPAAKWFLALIARERGEEDAAVALLKQINAVAPSAEVAAAIADPGIRLKVTTREAVAARTDPWDPESGPDAAELAGERAAEARAKLLAEATAELDAQIGMGALKDQIKTFRARIRMAAKRRELGLKTPGSANHMVFVGPPGTGKTTIARVMANILAGLGVIAEPKLIETGRRDFVGEYEGHSAAKTGATINSALDGVLFIDEAYTLVQERDGRADPFGKEALDTLLARMENDRDRLVVVIAGYENDIDRLLAANEGLRGRFAHRFKFETYSAGELVAIAEAVAVGRDDVLAESAVEVLRATCGRLAELRIGDRSAIDVVGNGRFVRKVIEGAADFRDLRLEEDPPEVLDATTLTTIIGADMALGLRKVLAAESSEAGSDLTQLVEIVGS